MIILYNDPIFYNALLVLFLLLIIRLTPTTYENQVVEVPSVWWVLPVSAFVVWALASNPVLLGSWTDRGAYGGAVLNFQLNGFDWSRFSLRGEWAFDLYVYIVSQFTDYKGFFYVTAALYVMNYFVAAYRMTRDYAYVLFISVISNFQFYTYGENTIRAGLAASVVALGLTFCNRVKVMLLLFFLAFSIHHSLAIPIFALLIAYKFNKPKLFLFGWIGAILLSWYAGSAFENFLLDFSGDNRTRYLAVHASQTFYRIGFRWDFLAYSAIPVILGYYFIFVRNFKSEFYQWIYTTYLITNSFWVLVIRAEYTDRFAYLSWFLFPILLMYPLLSKQLFKYENEQRNTIVLILFGQLIFNYFMFLLYNRFKPWY